MNNNRYKVDNKITIRMDERFPLVIQKNRVVNL
jgi:hypothetical protein